MQYFSSSWCLITDFREMEAPPGVPSQFNLTLTLSSEKQRAPSPPNLFAGLCCEYIVCFFKIFYACLSCFQRFLKIGQISLQWLVQGNGRTGHISCVTAPGLHTTFTYFVFISEVKLTIKMLNSAVRYQSGESSCTGRP